MTVKLLDGRDLAQRLRRGQKARADHFLSNSGRRPGLAVVLVGDDPASQVYVRRKVAACVEAGIHSSRIDLAADVETTELLRRIDRLNSDPAVDGILVQLPLPPQIDASAVLARVLPAKDVDGFHLENVGALAAGTGGPAPCTPAGVIALLDDAGVAIDGRHAVVVGRSNIVGKPMALMLLARGATVTIAHSRTRDLGGVTRGADILVAAVGRPHLVDAQMVKPGAIVVDVGINRLPDGRLCGDVDHASVAPLAAAITPVPGGVGPMTVAMLLENTLAAAERRAGLA